MSESGSPSNLNVVSSSPRLCSSRAATRLVASLLLCLSAAFAQQANAANGPEAPGLQEITVTARRVKENLQKVPIAINVVSREVLERRNEHDFEALAQNVPGLTIFGGRGSSTPSITNIRGVPGVVAYFADVPTTLQGAGMLFDIADVQVLKGPQGTLFGISTDGGAILVRPVKPSSRLEGYGEVTAGDYGHLEGQGALNIPLIGDKLDARLAFISSHTDGIGRILGTGQRVGDENYSALRLSVVAHPFDELENYTIVNYYDSHNTNFPNVLRAVDPNGLAAQKYGAANLLAILAAQQALGDYTVAGVDELGYTKARNLNLVNTTTYEISDKLSVKNILGYQRSFFILLNDNDGTIFPINQSDPRTQEPKPVPTWTEELQLIGSHLWNRLDFQTGTFLSGSHGDPNNPQGNDNIGFSTSFGSTTAVQDYRTSRTRAVYGQANYDLSALTPGLGVTAGYRYTWDRRTEINTRYTLSTMQPNRVLSDAADFGSGSYTLGLQYQVDPQLMLFITNSKGYSAGGFTLTAPPPFNVFQPESLSNVEIGFKSQFSIGAMRARANVSYFYGWYQNKQTTQAILAQINPPPAPLTLIQTTTNAGAARPHGFDADITVLPTTDLEVSLALSYVDAKYTRYVTLSSHGIPISRAGLPFVGVPAWKIAPHVAYYLPVPQSVGTVSLNADYTWYSRVLMDSNALVLDYAPYTSFRPCRKFLDASLGWSDVWGHIGLDVTLYGTNLTQEVGGVNGQGGYSLIGITADAPADPRMWGIRAGYRF